MGMGVPFYPKGFFSWDIFEGPVGKCWDPLRMANTSCWEYLSPLPYPPPRFAFTIGWFDGQCPEDSPASRTRAPLCALPLSRLARTTRPDPCPGWQRLVWFPGCNPRISVRFGLLKDHPFRPTGASSGSYPVSTYLALGLGALGWGYLFRL